MPIDCIYLQRFVLELENVIVRFKVFSCGVCLERHHEDHGEINPVLLKRENTDYVYMHTHNAIIIKILRLNFAS